MGVKRHEGEITLCCQICFAWFRFSCCRPAVAICISSLTQHVRAGGRPPGESVSSRCGWFPGLSFFFFFVHDDLFQMIAENQSLFYRFGVCAAL